ncbi:UDP-galactopyranose mutase [Citrobacter freundii]|uniref:UDP-galactopyranose mutase n=1 Tax=Citrobacter freundii TaxID=546 RepID=A0AAI9HD89_CITFR|nr:MULTISPECIES: UDP-galactopyranose mutase [Citrobacter]EKV7197950.1 UDP-galactopyranose mutase [Citrobacter freundii]EKW4406290.1 UDP-galactopyranose mutase [Citrobacter freundii]EKX8775491.1 UDP-galactopyranose mutase [Citrobacter freundii]ELF4153678.1 UDP-galactopyranose mutase [Citrobacter freundii]ELI8779751.1 UDP-galactopyranose mutase [Citrobacter freundii]
MYDYLIVGAGFYGAVCARELHKKGKKVLVLEKREHIGGNAFTDNMKGIQVHKYGAHIFHTNDKLIWDYVNQYADFNRFTNAPIAIHKDKLYNLPFNMNTFYQLWGVKTPHEAMEVINAQRAKLLGKTPSNLEEKAISLVGEDIYNILIKGYTEKQWGRRATALPPFIISRLPVRFSFDNNYFSDRYQGIPIGGYTEIFKGLLDGIRVELGVDYLKNKSEYNKIANNIIYTGAIDEYFDYVHGELEYRSLKFEHTELNVENHQGNAVINYTERTIPYTRIIEHKHFDYVDTPHTIITKEYPVEWKRGDDAYYPINDKKNMELFARYRELASQENNVHFGGRLAEYKYYDMHQVIKSALNYINKNH